LLPSSSVSNFRNAGAGSRKLVPVWNISSTVPFYPEEQVFFAPETYGRRDLYQAEGLLDQALNLVDVNVGIQSRRK